MKGEEKMPDSHAFVPGGLKLGESMWFSRFANFLTWLLCLVVLILFCRYFGVLLGIDAWRHDAVYYLLNGHTNVAAEGRWLEQLVCFDLLKAMPPFLSILVSYAGFFCFIFIVSHQITGDVAYSVLIGLTSLLIPSIGDYVLWPESLVIPSLLLCLACFLQNRIRNRFLYFLLLSVLFFGGISVFYFLTVLLQAPSFLNTTGELPPERRKRFFRMLAVFVACYVIGYVIVNLFVAIKYGHAIRLASWRDPREIHSLVDLAGNIERAMSAFVAGLSACLSALNKFFWIALLALYICFRHYRSTGAYYSLILFVMGTAVYAQTIPYGVSIGFRTAVPLWTSLLFFFLVFPRISSLEKVVYSVLCCVLAFALFTWTDGNAVWFRDMTKIVEREFKKVLPPPSEVQGIVLAFSTPEIDRQFRVYERNLGYAPRHTENLSNAYRFAPVLKELGYCTKGAAYLSQNYSLAPWLKTMEFGNILPLDWILDEEEQRRIKAWISEQKVETDPEDLFSLAEREKGVYVVWINEKHLPPAGP